MHACEGRARQALKTRIGGGAAVLAVACDDALSTSLVQRRAGGLMAWAIYELQVRARVPGAAAGAAATCRSRSPSIGAPRLAVTNRAWVPLRTQGGGGPGRGVLCLLRCDGALESRQAIAGVSNKEKPVQLSQQELVDCMRRATAVPAAKPSALSIGSRSVAISIAVGDNNKDFMD
ncbi:hypothetical protein C2845_PM02G43200 [Panicum miliaceum]|uniref:Uncharacterized protein n=1 Tax=Panicum miliaceum TaxID=4540 RepID=A0A3L6S9N5_PANMI|nr:hypothetical protein C2845_PM02G43200 [Panicum miliaceum]